MSEDHLNLISTACGTTAEKLEPLPTTASPTPVRKALIVKRTGEKMDVYTSVFTEAKSEANVAEELPFIFDTLFIYMDRRGSVLPGLVDMCAQRDGDTTLFHLIDTQMHGIPADKDQTCWVIEFEGIKSFKAQWTTEAIFDRYLAEEIVAKLTKVSE